jgi:hypothetical protein
MGPKDTLKTLLPRHSEVILIYDDSEPETITGHRITRLNGPQVRLGSRWYYLYQLRGGRELLEQYNRLEAAALAKLV